MDRQTRAFFEPRLGHDFSEIKIHADAKAAASAQAVDAEAYTVGRHIVFNRERYAPRSDAGLSLIAHELAHTVQQSGSDASALASQAAAERFAEDAAHAVMQGRAVPPLGKTAVGLARSPLPLSPENAFVKPRESSGTELYFTFQHTSAGGMARSPLGASNQPQMRPVDSVSLAEWALRSAGEGIAEKRLEQRVLGSYEFTGDDRARRYWAAFLRANYSSWSRQRLIERQAELERVRQSELEEEKRIQAKQLEEFMAGTYKGNFSRDQGFFHAEYSPSQGVLTITVPFYFEFMDSEESVTRFNGDLNGQQPVQMINENARRTWSKNEEEAFRGKFIKIVEERWSKQHRLYCYKTGLEALQATVIVKADGTAEADKIGGPDSPFRVRVFRGDTPEQLCMGREACVLRSGVILNHRNVDDGSSTAAHEFGHMLGLGDEYADDQKPLATIASHSELVEKEFDGEQVPRLGSDRQDRFRESIMNSSSSGRVLPEHGVTFLEAMRQITGIQEWHLRPKGQKVKPEIPLK